MSFSVTWIIFFSLLLVSFLAIVLTAKLLSKPKDEYKFSFMRIFPFEVIRSADDNGRYYSLATYLFSGICFSPIILVVSEQVALKTLNPLSILIACVLGLASICFVFLNIFDVTHTKPHLILFAIFALLTLLGGILVTVRGFIAYDTFAKHGTNEYVFLVTAIASELLGVIPTLILILNPKLKTWAVLDKVDDEYVRPKKFTLAYSEWGLLLALFLIETTYFVQLLVK